jgi:hypothetical protein
VENIPDMTGQGSGHIPDWSRIDIATARANIGTAGFTRIDSLFSLQLLSELRSEAFHKKKDAIPACGTSQCQYQAHLAGLGKAGIAFLSADRMLNLLDTLFGMPLTLEVGASCYTYYQPGDFLGPHQDHAELCFATAILYLDVVHSDNKHDKTGLELHVFGTSPAYTPKPRLVLPTKAGSLITGLGAENWHARPPLQNGEFITALTACYSRRVSA